MTVLINSQSYVQQFIVQHDPPPGLLLIPRTSSLSPSCPEMLLSPAGSSSEPALLPQSCFADLAGLLEGSETFSFLDSPTSKNPQL